MDRLMRGCRSVVVPSLPACYVVSLSTTVCAPSIPLFVCFAPPFSLLWTSRSFASLASDWSRNELTSVRRRREEREMALEGSHPFGPSRQLDTRLESSSLCVGVRYCSLRRQVSLSSFHFIHIHLFLIFCIDFLSIFNFETVWTLFGQRFLL